MLAEELGTSEAKVQRFIRLTHLSPELLALVDEGRMKMLPAVEVSYLSEAEQESLLGAIEANQCTPSHAQAIRMKRLSKERSLTDTLIRSIMEEQKPNQVEQFKIPRKSIARFFRPSATEAEIEKRIVRALDLLAQAEKARLVPAEGEDVTWETSFTGARGAFTHVENTIFFDHGLSAKAKGIYCQIRSLENNSEWVFSVKGFASLLRDGVDSVAAGLKELEAAGYIIRARKRGENGRFLKAEEATWITLDDPAMHTSVTDELKAEGYTVLSEFKRDPGNDAKFELENALPAMDKTEPPNPKVSTRTGKSRSGKTRSGKSVTINNLSYKELIESSPSLVPPEDMLAKEGRGRVRVITRNSRRMSFPKHSSICAQCR